MCVLAPDHFHGVSSGSWKVDGGRGSWIRGSLQHSQMWEEERTLKAEMLFMKVNSLMPLPIFLGVVSPQPMEETLQQVMEHTLSFPERSGTEKFLYT